MEVRKEFRELVLLIERLGERARVYFDSDTNPATQKADGSVVTEIDTHIETEIRKYISTQFPDDTIIGEEGDRVKGTSGFVWYIDPIDGTDNFVRKIPFFCVTAVRLGSSPEDSFAIIHNPVSGQTFSSLMEDGVYENHKLCALTADTTSGKHYITVAKDKSYAPWVRQTSIVLIGALSERFGKSGHYHSSLLELAYVAAGRIDGFLSLGQKPWDTAAGLYLVRAAGGAISVLEGGEWVRYEEPIKDLYGASGEEPQHVFVSHPDIHGRVLDFVGDPESWAK